MEFPTGIFYGLDGPWQDHVVESDWIPEGRQITGICCRRCQTIGCVVFQAAEVIAPGVVRNTYSNRFSLGEPDGGT